MKTLVKLLTVAIMMLTLNVITSKEVKSQHASVSFQVFYDQLSPYGTWVDYPDYGYVWVPDAGPGFSPYASNGHWVYTQYGWTWVSDYPWGWAPFHYGRWHYDPYYGDVWVPDTEWGPAWVTWRRSEGYYGWAPLGPNISLSVAFGPSYNVPHNRWIFVRDRDLTRRDIPRYYVDRSTNVTIINNSTVIQNTYVDNSRNTTYIAGPDKSDIQKATGKSINPVAVRDSDTPKQQLGNNQLQIYRPQVKKTDAQGQRPAPSKVTKKEDVKPVSERAPGKANTKAAPANRQKDEQPVRKSTQPQSRQKAEPAQKMNPPEGQKKEQPAQKMNQPEGQKQAQPVQKMNQPEGQKQAQPARQVSKPESEKQKQTTVTRTQKKQQRTPARTPKKKDAPGL